jgi:hypothetical protein
MWMFVCITGDGQDAWMSVTYDPGTPRVVPEVSPILRTVTSARNAAQSGSTESSNTARAEWLSGAVSGFSPAHALIER